MSFRLTRARALLILLLLFTASILIRHSLFNQEFTYSWEWLSAHTLITVQLWNAVPAEIHHFNLLYTFPQATDKFIDDLWRSGVVDRLGNFYYVSMPHLAFFTPYLFLKLTGQQATLGTLQVFALVLHAWVLFLLYLLVRRLTRDLRGSRLAAIAGFCVLLFAPTALYFYQNAVVGTVLVIPYTIGTLLSVDVLFRANESRNTRRIAWAALFLCLVLGCLTDWQAYFTAFATAVVALILGVRRPADRPTAAGITAVCCLSVALAVLLMVAQDSRIHGLQPFVQTILGRLRVRAGASSSGLGLTTIGYYRNLARFYSAYGPFLLFGVALVVVAMRRNREATRSIFRRAKIVLAVATLAVLVDHIVLANHTSQQNFTTVNSLVPIGILAGIAAAAFLETGGNTRRDALLISAALALCIAVSVGEYYVAYRNRPHPFKSAATQILAAAQPTDMLFATGSGFTMSSDYIIPQMLYYLRHNVEVVGERSVAEQRLACRGFARGTLVHLTKDYEIRGIETVHASQCAEAMSREGGL